MASFERLFVLHWSQLICRTLNGSKHYLMHCTGLHHTSPHLQIPHPMRGSLACNAIHLMEFQCHLGWFFRSSSAPQISSHQQEWPTCGPSWSTGGQPNLCSCPLLGWSGIQCFPSRLGSLPLQRNRCWPCSASTNMPQEYFSDWYVWCESDCFTNYWDIRTISKPSTSTLYSCSKTTLTIGLS